MKLLLWFLSSFLLTLIVIAVFTIFWTVLISTTDTIAIALMLFGLIWLASVMIIDYKEKK